MRMGSLPLRTDKSVVQLGSRLVPRELTLTSPAFFLSNLGVSVGRAGLLFEVLLSGKLSSGVQGIER